jgi:hypothetical protein
VLIHHPTTRLQVTAGHLRAVLPEAHLHIIEEAVTPAVQAAEVTIGVLPVEVTMVEATAE